MPTPVAITVASCWVKKMTSRRLIRSSTRTLGQPAAGVGGDGVAHQVLPLPPQLVGKLILGLGRGDRP